MRFWRVLINLVSLAVVCSLAIGCASFGKQLKSMVGGGSGKDTDSSSQKSVIATPRFSEQENMRPVAADTERQYKRMNRQRFEEESELKEDAGSLWVMEGQGAYLFAQNQTRVIGDLLNVKIDGAPKTQLSTKVKVISKLLERLDGPSRGLASQQGASQPAAQASPAPGQPPGAAQANANNTNGAQPNAAEGAANAAGDAKDKNDSGFSVQQVPTRIVEQLKDGSYRVRGMQPFMIGKREYKVIVTGIVRGEDFDDAGIDAGKLLDPQFDIVSSRKGASL